MQYVQDAGFAIWPILALDLATLALASYHAVRPRADLVPLIIGFGVATLLAGALGTVIGIQTSVHHIEKVAEQDRWLFLVGVRESLNNVLAALVMTSLAALTTSVGSFRRARVLAHAEGGAR